MLDRILVPLDGSATAEAVLPQVKRLLKRKDTEVVLLRIVDLQPISEMEFGTVIGMLMDDATKYASALEARLAADGVRVRSIVRNGTVAGTILDVADEVKATMIAMSTHGRSGVARWALGSVAEKVVRAGSVPVLLLRSFEDGKAVDAGERRIAKILVPIDGSRASIDAVPAAIAFAKLFDSRAVVLTIEEIAGINPPATFSGSTVERPAAAPAMPKDPTAEDLVRFASLSFAAEGIPTTLLRVSGEPAAEILHQSATQDADLIAMTTHGRSGPARWVLGSVAEKVLRGADVPVLLVKSRRK